MIDPNERAKLKGLEAFINGNILSQPEVVREMVPILINGELGINSQGKPKASFIGAARSWQNRDLQCVHELSARL
jgi:hypothetical protein